MDFSAVCLDGMLGVGLNSSSNHNLNPLKHCRSASEMDMEQTTSRDQDWRSSNSLVKMPRTESYVPALMRSTSMISDASRLETSNSGASDLLESAEQATRLMRSDSVVSPYNKSGLSLPFYQTSSGAAYQYASGSNKPAGMVPVSLSMGGSGGVHAMFAGARMNPFTTSQWQELEHQALIFKYMMAGVQVPPELLIPIRKNTMNMNMNMNIFSSLSGVGSLRSNLGWSSFHLGFANNADPEPGRCRRTDGKKWRCSRDAVPDQKYCERHMNRGRHRSRKPVEGQTQTSHAAAAATSHSSSGAALSSSATSLAAAAARSAVTVPNTTSNTNPSPSLANLRPSIGTQSQQHHHQHQQQQQQQQQQQHIGIKSSAYPPSIDAATPFPVPLTVDRYLNGMKGDLSGQFFDSSSQSIHGGLFNDGAWRSRIVPQSAKTTNNLMNFESRTLVDDAQDFGLGQMNLLPMAAQRNEQRQEQQRPAGGIRHFFDDWPSSRDRSAALSWSEIEQMRTSAATTAATTAAPASSATQLSISIPSDFSSPASPNNKLTLSPLKLSTSRSEDPLGMDMGLGVGMGLGIETEHRHRQHQQTNWIPITWESPVGGPLAEVLNSTSTTSHDCNGKNSSSALNLMTGEGWDCSSNSPRGDTSPTGVLQKTLGSLSDSSTGSSPRAVKAAPETALCENLRTATFVTAGAQISTA